MVNFQITQGTGTTIATDTGGGGENYQKIKLIDATTGATQGTGIAANPLQVSLSNTGSNAIAIIVDGSAVTQPISATSLPLSTNAAQETGGNLDDIKTDLDQFTFVASRLIVDGSGVIQPISGTVTVSNPGLTDTQLRASPVPVTGTITTSPNVNLHDGTGTSISSTGSSLNVDITNATLAVTQSGLWTVTANAGTGNFTVVQSSGSNLHVDVDNFPSTQIVQNAGVATAVLTNVAQNASSVTLLSANASRKGATVHNDSSSFLYIKFGAVASTSSFTVRLANQSYYEVPFEYTGIMDAIWDGAGVGFARVTELS